MNRTLLSNEITSARHHDPSIPYFKTTTKEENKRLYHFRLMSSNPAGTNDCRVNIWQQLELHQGLWMSFLALPANRSVELCHNKQPSMIDFAFILSGHVRHQMYKSNQTKCMNAEEGQSVIGYFPDRNGVVNISIEKPLHILHIHISPERLFQMVHHDLELLPLDFRSITEGNTHKQYQMKAETAPRARAIVLDIINYRFNGLPKGLFLEHKALELISIQIGNIINPQASNSKSDIVRFSRSEKDRVIAAKNFLVQDLSSPPSLSELSRRFCLSQNKLQYGFRMLFGHSVYGCLREHKMKEALRLFDSTEMNVSHVAWAVGYSNVSQFTKAYKKRFGILPKHYLQAITCPRSRPERNGDVNL